MSRLNRNANYIYVVDGETVWERLRVIRTFLEERKTALAINELNQEKLDRLDKTSFEYREYLILKPQQDKLLEECLEEIKFLEDFEAKLAVEAEKQRIPGKTDDEMYELNFFEEMRVRLVKDAQSEMISMGQILPQTMKALLRHKPALESCVQLGMLAKEVLSQASLPQLGMDIGVLLLESR